MPSPGRIAIFIPRAVPGRPRPCVRPPPGAARRPNRRTRPQAWRDDPLQPRLLGEMPRLERADLVGVLQREADIVPAVQQAALAERIDVEVERKRAVRAADRLAIEIDRE